MTADAASRVRVGVDVPAGWLDAAIERPKIAESSGAFFASYAASRAPADAPRAPTTALVRGCVATPVPGWVEDMRPAVEGRTIALAGAAAAKITGAPVDARSDGQGAFALRLASDLDGPHVGTARTFVGFDEDGHVLTCFATCAGPPPPAGSPPSSRACDAATATARLEGSSPAPAPGLALRGVTWAVHHPVPFAEGAAIAVFTAGFLAVVLRRRPRSSVS